MARQRCAAANGQEPEAVIQPLSDFFGRPHSPAELLVLYSIATVMLGLPQLVIALAGGLLSAVGCRTSRETTREAPAAWALDEPADAFIWPR